MGKREIKKMKEKLVSLKDGTVVERVSYYQDNKLRTQEIVVPSELLSSPHKLHRVD